MRISHGTRINDISTTNGYGYATDRMAHALTRLGHDFVPNDANAPVQIWFDQPHHWKWNDNDQYRIGYHPWESTRLKDGWSNLMNDCDEIWTPSPLIARWYREHAGVKRPVYVYEHGVDPIWAPVERKVEDKIHFLHVGAEAARKGGWETMRAFRAAFPNRNDVQLTLKMINPGFNLPAYGKCAFLNESLTLKQLVKLFQAHHVFVYPSWGEGFGLNPLQAMATGMPTIIPGEWAPYKRFLDPNLNMRSKMMTSPWPQIHPGKMLAPNMDDLVDRMRWVADNYDAASAFALSQTPKIAEEYDWLALTKDAFSGLEQRMENHSNPVALERSI